MSEASQGVPGGVVVSEFNANTASPQQLETYFREDAGFLSFEEALRNAAKGLPDEECCSLVVTRKPFRTHIGGSLTQLPPRSHITGLAQFTDEARVIEDLRPYWEGGVAPLTGPPGEEVSPVSGEFFGRDDTVFIVAETIIPDPDAWEVGQ